MTEAEDMQAAETVSKAQDRRFHAMMERDTAALDGLLADELTYAHANGATETKAEFLETIESGVIRYESVRPEETQIRVYGGAAVVTGTSEMDLRIAGRETSFRIRFLSVYARQPETWQMVAWQSTRFPNDAGGPG